MSSILYSYQILIKFELFKIFVFSKNTQILNFAKIHKGRQTDRQTWQTDMTKLIFPFAILQTNHQTTVDTALQTPDCYLATARLWTRSLLKQTVTVETIVQLLSFAFQLITQYDREEIISANLDTVMPTEEQFQYCYPLLLFAIPASGKKHISTLYRSTGIQGFLTIDKSFPSFCVLEKYISGIIPHEQVTSVYGGQHIATPSAPCAGNHSDTLTLLLMWRNKRRADIPAWFTKLRPARPLNTGLGS